MSERSSAGGWEGQQGKPTVVVLHEEVINATRDRVWAVFSDFRKAKAWTSVMKIKDPRTCAEVMEGCPISVRTVNINGHVTRLKATVTKKDSGRALAWQHKLLGFDGLFVRERSFTFLSHVDKRGIATTRFIQREEFSGKLLSLMGGAVRRSKEDMEELSADLKRRVEALYPRAQQAKAPAAGPRPQGAAAAAAAAAVAVAAQAHVSSSTVGGRSMNQQHHRLTHSPEAQQPTAMSRPGGSPVTPDGQPAPPRPQASPPEHASSLSRGSRGSPPSQGLRTAQEMLHQSSGFGVGGSSSGLAVGPTPARPSPLRRATSNMEEEMQAAQQQQGQQQQFQRTSPVPTSGAYGPGPGSSGSAQSRVASRFRSAAANALAQTRAGGPNLGHGSADGARAGAPRTSPSPSAPHSPTQQPQPSRMSPGGRSPPPSGSPSLSQRLAGMVQATGGSHNSNLATPTGERRGALSDVTAGSGTPGSRERSPSVKLELSPDSDGALTSKKPSRWGFRAHKGP